jgi:hypothetical protein
MTTASVNGTNAVPPYRPTKDEQLAFQYARQLSDELKIALVIRILQELPRDDQRTFSTQWENYADEVLYDAPPQEPGPPRSEEEQASADREDAIEAIRRGAAAEGQEDSELLRILNEARDRLPLSCWKLVNALRVMIGDPEIFLDSEDVAKALGVKAKNLRTLKCRTNSKLLELGIPLKVHRSPHVKQGIQLLLVR